METEAFRIQFEQTCNMELDKTTLSPAEAEAFAALFEEVVWYSPFPEERARIPSYRGEAEIRAAAESAAARIGMTHETT